MNESELARKNCAKCNNFTTVPKELHFCPSCLMDMRNVPDFPNYMAHKDGSIWNFKRGTRLHHATDIVTLSRKGPVKGKQHRESHPVGRVVLSAFQPPTRDGIRCRHKDGNPYRNNIENLEWEPDPSCTPMPPDMVDGVWRRQIPEHPEYAADEQGRIWRYGKRNPQRVRCGNRVYLYRNGKGKPYHIAPLVLHAFKGKELDSQIPLWKDGNRYNNRPDNLEWTDYIPPAETLSSRCNVSPKHTHKAKPRSFTLEEIERGEHLT